jgi:hypothetical protein
VPAGLADFGNDSAELVVMPFALDTRPPVKNGIVVTNWDRIIGVSHGRDQRSKSIFPFGVNTIPFSSLSWFESFGFEGKREPWHRNLTPEWLGDAPPVPPASERATVSWSQH